MSEGGCNSTTRAKPFKIGRIVIPYWLVALILASTIGLTVFGQYLTIVNVPLQVKEPLEILSYPSGWSLYPGQTTKFNITVMNNAPLNYSVVLDFQASNLTYQTDYMTFSHETYTVVPGQQNLEAQLTVAANAPATNVTVSIALSRLPSTTPNAANSLTNGNFETGTFYGWNVAGVCTISTSTVHSGMYSAYVSSGWAETNAIAQNLTVSAGQSILFEGWIYPLKVGNLGDAYSASSAITLWFCNAATMLPAFVVEYIWCWNNSHLSCNSSQGVHFLLPFTAGTWNVLSRNVTQDVLQYFTGINLSEYVLYSIKAQYHYSNGDPGAFYVDDLGLPATSLS